MSTNPDAVALSVSGLQKSYGDFPVIRDLNLQVTAGAVHGLVGLNGSGKTTTIECILGLQGFNGGRIEVLGRPPADLHRAMGKVVGIFDTPSLHPHLTLRQCLDHARLLCEQPRRSAAEVEQLLSIERFSDFRIRNLSLGNKRRAAIAQALLGAPELIVLDEPFNGLDAEGVDDVLALISRLNKEEGTAFLLSSHQLPYLEQICSHIAILHRGAIALSDATDALLSAGSSEVRLRTNQDDKALELIAGFDGAEFSGRDSQDYLLVEISGTNSARLNRLLVENGVDVTELILERASLGKLFREITAETAMSGGKQP